MKTSNEKLREQNVKLEDKVEGFEAALRLVLERVGHTSQVVAQDHVVGQQVHGRVLGLELNFAQVTAQVGSLGRELHQRNPPWFPPLNH